MGVYVKKSNSRAMKTILPYLLVVALALSTMAAHAQPRAFITTWETKTDNETIEFRLNASLEYDFIVILKDSDGNSLGGIQHTPSKGSSVSIPIRNAGTYTLEITGTFPHFIGYQKEKLLEVNQWGDIKWRRMNGSFAGWKGKKFIATDVPNLSQVTKMNNMFQDANSFNGDLSTWDVSNVKDMAGMFRNAGSFNGDLSSWNVEKVEDMANMFYGAGSFNGDLGEWNVSNVRLMNEMFRGAGSFNRDLSKWDVSKVTTMRGMFLNAGSFEGTGLSGWNTANVTTMSFMFFGADSFTGDISGWEVSKVENMASMFEGADIFNGNLSGWKVGKVRNMTKMFRDAGSFEGGDLSRWNVIRVKDMSFMFDSAGSFNGNLSGWKVDSVTTMENMFRDAGSFEGGDLSSWNTGKVTTMFSMFANAASFNGDVSTWDVGEVTSMSFMFFGANSFNGNVSGWNTGKVEAMRSMFEGAGIFNGNLSGWKVGKVQNMTKMFRNAGSFEGGDLSGWNTGKVKNMAQMFLDAASFNANLGDWQITNVTDMTDMFTNSGLSWRNYDRILIAWGVTAEKQIEVTLGAGGVNFCESEHHRNNVLKRLARWKITDGGRHCPNRFITTWQTTTDNEAVGFRMNDTLTYDFEYTWRDSNDEIVKSASQTSSDIPTVGPEEWRYLVTATMGDAGTYTLEITGTFPHFIYDQKEMLLDVKQWGNIKWRSMNGSFRDFKGESFTAPDVPDLSRVEDMARMFEGAGSFNGDLGEWNVSNVRLMNEMFRGAGSFNGDLSEWDVSKVETMRGMFVNAGSFEGEGLSGWNTANVTSMSFMFFGADSFTGDISGWEVSKVENMASMFEGADIFNGNLSGWKVGNVQNMTKMFLDAGSFEGRDLSRWNVIRVKDMSSMFENAGSFNGDVSSWKVDSVTTMENMFFGATAFDGIVSSWNVEKVENMQQMFRRAVSFKGRDLSGWNVSKVTTMQEMFRGAASFNGNLSGWNTGKVENMRSMFRGAISFNGNLSGWKVGKVENMEGMFRNARSFEGTGLRRWNVSKVTTMEQMFLDAASFDKNLGNWQITNVTDMTDMFTNSGLSWQNYDGILIGWGATAEKQIEVTLGAGGVNFCNGAYARRILRNIARWDITDGGRHCPDHFITTWQTTTDNEVITFKLTDTLTYDFEYNWRDSNDEIVAHGWRRSSDISPANPNPELFYTVFARIDDAGTYTLEVTGTFHHFASDQIEMLRDVKQWGNIKWRSMNGSFRDFKGESFTAPDVPDLSRVEDMADMFRGAQSFNGDLSEWDVSNVRTMQEMFRNARSFNGDLSEWDVSKVENMRGMFLTADAFKGEGISGWNTANVTNMSTMFFGADTFNGNISGWEVSKIETMADMFGQADAFNGNLSGWKVGNVKTMARMFDGSGLSQSNYDRTLIGWAAQKELQKNVELGADGISFCNGADARGILTGSTHNWKITDAGEQCPADATDIIAFTLDEEAGPPIINDAAHTVYFEVVPGTDLTALAPVLTLPPGATSSPASGQLVDFSSPVTYTVTSQDGTAIQEWTVAIFSREVFTQTLDGDEGWRMLSVPVSGRVFDKFLADFWTQGFRGAKDPDVTKPSNLLTWDHRANKWVSFTDLATDSLRPGHGFIFYVFSDDNGPNEDGDAGFPKKLTTANFGVDARLNSGSITPVNDLGYSEFFLVGNPYGYPIDWDKLAKTSLSNTVYVYDHSISNYLSWNGFTGNISGGKIAPFQSFFIQGFGVQANTGSLTIEETDKMSDEVRLHKQAGADPLVLTLRGEAGGLVSEAWLSFQPGGEPGRDAYDGLAMQSLDTTFLRLATILDNRQALAINALPVDYNEELTFPLELSGTVAEETAELSFEGLEHFEGWEIKIHDLRTGNVYPVEQAGSIRLELENPKAQVVALPSPSIPTPVPVKAKGSAARYRLVLEPPAVVGTEPGVSEVPEHVELQQNYPNPFNPATVISYTVPQAGPVRLEVFDLVGRKVATLLERESQGPGRYEVRFDASALASGVYIYRLQAGSHILVKRMTLIK